jgi:hypothetical protein
VLSFQLLLLPAVLVLCLLLQPRLGDPSTSGGGLILSTILVAWGTAIVLGGKGLLAKRDA